MEALSINLPAMYGDHHVTDVRRILFELPGVADVYASSAHHMAIVQFDPDKVEKQAILDRLGQAGYLQEMQIPVESSTPAYGRDETSEAFFRHTASHVQTKTTVSFAQDVNNGGRPLWPCPGMGLVATGELEEND